MLISDKYSTILYWKYFFSYILFVIFTWICNQTLFLVHIIIVEKRLLYSLET